VLADGATLAVGDRLRVRVHNTDLYHALYFAVYRLTAARTIDLLARCTAHGLCALPRDADCRGVLLAWPEMIDRSGGAQQTLASSSQPFSSSARASRGSAVTRPRFAQPDASPSSHARRKRVARCGGSCSRRMPASLQPSALP